MKDLQIGDKIEVKISKITMGTDKKVYVTVESPIFDNRPSFFVKEDKFVWKSESGRVTIR